MRRCVNHSLEYPLAKWPPGVGVPGGQWWRLGERRDLVVEVFADRLGGAPHTNHLVHLAFELLHVGVEANLLPRPCVGVFVAKRRRDPRAVALVEDQRAEADVS